MSTIKVIKDADQTEIEALLNASAPLDAGISDDRQASALDSIDTDEGGDWSARDAELDDISSDVATELNYRFKLLGDAYPFILEGASLKLKESSVNLFYLFCLILSNCKLRAERGTTANNQLLARLFERVTLNIIKNSLGSLSKGHHFGFPRDDNSGILDALNDIQHTLGVHDEWQLSPLPYRQQELSKQKDLGVDQIIWIKRPDGRSFSHLFFLGQCACGDDYVHKYNDIDLKKLNQYFRPFTHIEPVKMMSIPFILTDGKFKEVSNQAGWIFDRISLSSIYHQHPNLMAEYDKQLVKLIAQSTPYGPRFSESSFYEAISTITKDINNPTLSPT